MIATQVHPIHLSGFGRPLDDQELQARLDFTSEVCLALRDGRDPQEIEAPADLRFARHVAAILRNSRPT